MQAHIKLSPNKERFTRELPVLLQGFTREKIDIIWGAKNHVNPYTTWGAFRILITWPELYPILIH